LGNKLIKQQGSMETPSPLTLRCPFRIMRIFSKGTWGIFLFPYCEDAWGIPWFAKKQADRKCQA